MYGQISTAVAAAASEGVRIQLMRAFAENGVELLAMERDAAAAMEAVRRLKPDLLAADEQLPLLDGASLLLKVLTARELPVRPAAILLHWPESPMPLRTELESMHIPCISKPLTGDRLRCVLEALHTAPPFFPEREVQLITQLLDALGMPEYIGRSCLKTAVLLCAGDVRMRSNMSGRLYPSVGKLCNLSAAQAQRSMRHAIDLAWQSNQFENQYRIFADTVDAGRGQPTCGEMISRLADILRLEG